MICDETYEDLVLIIDGSQLQILASDPDGDCLIYNLELSGGG
jgi:hypothetical protein